MNDVASLPRYRQAVVWWLVFALLLPSLAGCVTRPPPTVRLDGIVVDGQRLARPGETGLARVLRDGSAQEARAGMELRAGDRVESGPNAFLVIRYPSGSEVFMRPNSGGRIGSLTEVVGELFVKVKGLFSVDTTFVRAGARGTAYLVRTAASGATTVVVLEGSVAVDSTRGAWATVLLPPGTMAVAHPRPPQAMPASEAEMQRTRDWVERLERLVPAPTGVSSTGVAIGVASVAAMLAAILSMRSGGGGKNEPASPAPQGSGGAYTVKPNPPASGSPPPR